jgi:SAM-dependent methyltransferase
VLQPLIHKLQRISEQVQDWRLGIRTFEFHTQIDPTRPESRGYMPTSYRDWRLMKPYVLAGPQSSFIDYGAGLGRVTILAAQFVFRCVIGVEFSPSLVERARANVTSARAALRSPIKFVCVDAGAFEMPDDASTLFFNNPFAGSVLVSVLEQVRASCARRPRSLRLICTVPEHSAFEQEISAVSWLELTRHYALTGGRRCMIFEPIGTKDDRRPIETATARDAGSRP